MQISLFMTKVTKQSSVNCVIGIRMASMQPSYIYNTNLQNPDYTEHWTTSRITIIAARPTHQIGSGLSFTGPILLLVNFY